MEKIIFSKEQENIFEYAQKGVLNMIVQSVAGSGKTTTLVECVRRLSRDKSILMLAHNKSTRETLKERIGHLDNVKIYTLHGLGWRMFTEHFGFEPTIIEDKYKNYFFKNIDEFCGEEYSKLNSASKMIYKSNVLDIVDKARQNLKQSEKEIKKLMTKKYGMLLVSNECEIASNLLKWGCEDTNIVDYQDLLCFPYEFGYYTKKYLSDIIMLDEAQDASIAQQDIISRCFKRNTRLFAVGDEDQAINSWCGSDTKAFEHLKDSDKFRRDAEEFELTTNYRCGKKIIEYAKKYTESDIHATDNAEDGTIDFMASLSTTKDGDMILCRNISPLMGVYRDGIANGKKMYFRGSDLGKSLINIVECSHGNTIDEVIFNIKKRLIASWEILTSNLNQTEKEASKDPRIVSIMDTIKTLECLPENIKTRDDLVTFATTMFSDEGREGIELSTIHRAKGLEAENVYIICPSLIPSKFATLDWEIEEEEHLQYVMCTRAKKSLNFVSESEVKPPYALFETNCIYNELKKIRKEIRTI